MTAPVAITLSRPEISHSEILRYGGAMGRDEETLQLMESCLDEILPKLVYRVVWSRVSIVRRGACMEFGGISTESRTLALALDGCDEAILFAATVGLGPDRMVARYGRISPARALMHQAIGAERVESLCDAFSATLSKELSVSFRTRVSAGYGDIPLEMQRDFFSLLDIQRKIGVSLNGSLLMSPTKSVTAIMGIKKIIG